MMGVLPDCQGTDVGRQLMRYTFEKNDRAGCRAMWKPLVKARCGSTRASLIPSEKRSQFLKHRSPCTPWYGRRSDMQQAKRAARRARLVYCRLSHGSVPHFWEIYPSLDLDLASRLNMCRMHVRGASGIANMRIGDQHRLDRRQGTCANEASIRVSLLRRAGDYWEQHSSALLCAQLPSCALPSSGA
jgi:hypothetical protein